MPAKKTTTIKHICKLEGFDFEKGKISFDLLSTLSNQLIRLAESTLLSFIEGNSTIKKGKQPEWLSSSLDFQLSGLKAGSTVLVIEAPLLSTTLDNVQVSIFSDLKIEDVSNDSAIGLSMHAYEQAIKGKLDSPLLDKNLLQEMEQFGRLVNKKGLSISISSGKDLKPLKLRKESIEKIKQIESQTPSSIRTKVTGVLDVMKHSNNRLELIASNGIRIRAMLHESLNIAKLTPYFGKTLTVTGLAHFNPLGHVLSLEVSDFREKDDKEKYFTGLPVPLFEETDLKRVMEHQRYKGYRKEEIAHIASELNVNESLDDLLASLK